MRFFTVAVALLFLGCAEPEPSIGEQVPLLTQQHPYTGPKVGCFLYVLTGQLSVNRTYGTSIQGQPVMWPYGFTGFRVAEGVAVHDTEGSVVAVTGHIYTFIKMQGIPANDPGLAVNPFPACGQPMLQSDLWTPEPNH